jgi:NAD(P)-dependent dehydrogenase (short-subunit alcohol dehydrogenase family)
VATQEFGKKLLELKPPGKIINIASITSFIANGVLRMTEAFSNKWAGKGINVNRICLGELYGIYQGMGKGHHWRLEDADDEVYIDDPKFME